MKKDIKDFTLAQLETSLTGLGLPKYTARQVFSWVYQKGIEDFQAMSDIAKASRMVLEENYFFSTPVLLQQQLSQDGTYKFLWQLEDKATIESALIPDGGRLTLCLSSQVGCKYHCIFCLSGRDGFKRNLKPAEIINQYLAVKKAVTGKITNIVFMGTGEPLDNLDNVSAAIKILTDTKAVSFPKRKICISTSGVIEGIERLAQLQLGTKISLSLHAAKDELRSRLMPVNKKYPLAKVMKALGAYAGTQKLPVTFEYILIKGLNSTITDAQNLAHLLKGIDCKLNLIPCNAALLGLKAPDAQEIEAFLKLIQDAGIFCTVRKSKGQDIAAACGQLSAVWKKDAAAE